MEHGRESPNEGELADILLGVAFQIVQQLLVDGEVEGMGWDAPGSDDQGSGVEVEESACLVDLADDLGDGEKASGLAVRLDVINGDHGHVL